MSALIAAPLADPDHWHGAGWWVVFPVLWLVVFITIAAVVLTGIRRRRAFAGAIAGEARLAERFAAGEIDEDEYERRLAVLKAKR